MSAWCPNIFIYLCGNISQIWSWREVCTDWSACGTADCSLSLLVKLHRSPTQNAWVSVLHTAAGSERDSVVVRMKHSYLYNQISVNTWHQVMTTWVTRESLLFLLKLTWYFFFFFFADEVQCVQSYLCVRFLFVLTCKSIRVIRETVIMCYL